MPEALRPRRGRRREGPLPRPLRADARRRRDPDDRRRLGDGDERRRAPARRSVHARLREGRPGVRPDPGRRPRDPGREPPRLPHADREPAEPPPLLARRLHDGGLLRGAAPVGRRDGGRHARPRPASSSRGVRFPRRRRRSGPSSRASRPPGSSSSRSSSSPSRRRFRGSSRSSPRFPPPPSSGAVS